MYDNNNNQYSTPLTQDFKNELIRDDVKKLFIKQY
jgi:hypothetical protein